jgi:Fe-S cluster assembly scaffold protein SufB
MLNTNLIDISKVKTNTLILKNQCMFYIVDVENKDIDKQITIDLKENQTINVYLYTLCKAKNKQYKIKCIHKKNSRCNICIKALVNNCGNVKLNIENKVSKNISNVLINQDIQGITFDNDSKIIATPSMIISNNKIIANHSVSIGNLNPESLFYLTSRGLTSQQATIKLIESMFDKLHIEGSNDYLKIYDNLIQQANNLINI